MQARISGLARLTRRRTLDICMDAPASGGSIAFALSLTLTIRPGMAIMSAEVFALPTAHAMFTETSGITFGNSGEASRSLTASATSATVVVLDPAEGPYSLTQKSQSAKVG